MNTFNTDSFVFRDLNREKVLAKWTCDMSRGEDQIVHIQKGMDDKVVEDDDWGAGPIEGDAVHIKVTNKYPHAVDIYWSGNLHQVLVTLKSGTWGVVKTFHTHAFLVFQQGQKDPVLRRFVAYKEAGQKQKLSVGGPVELD